MGTESPAGDLGAAAPRFSLPATDGRTLTLDDVRGERGVVVVFMCNHCPYVKGALAQLIRGARDLGPLGIGIVGINANDARTYSEDSFDRMVAFAADAGLPFPYLYDETQKTARAYGAVCTPECFGFDANLRLRYRGRVGASRKDPVAGAPRDLFEAMRQVAQTGEGPAQQHPAFGCSIKWKLET